MLAMSILAKVGERGGAGRSTCIRVICLVPFKHIVCVWRHPCVLLQSKKRHVPGCVVLQRACIGADPASYESVLAKCPVVRLAKLSVQVCQGSAATSCGRASNANPVPSPAFQSLHPAHHVPFYLQLLRPSRRPPRPRMSS